MTVSVKNISMYNLSGMALAAIYTEEDGVTKVSYFDFAEDKKNSIISPDAEQMKEWTEIAIESHGKKEKRSAKEDEKPSTKRGAVKDEDDKPRRVAKDEDDKPSSKRAKKEEEVPARRSRKSEEIIYDRTKPDHKDLLGELVTQFWGGDDWSENDEFMDDLKDLIADQIDGKLAIVKGKEINEDILPFLEKHLKSWLPA